MKDVIWLGSSNDDVRDFPQEVREEVGFALFLAQRGDKAINAVPLVGFGNAMVPEIIVDHAGDTYRAVYTVQFEHAVYVLHAFKKKAKRGRQTPKSEIDLIKRRLKQARADYEAMYGKKAVRKRNVGTQGR